MKIAMSGQSEKLPEITPEMIEAGLVKITPQMVEAGIEVLIDFADGDDLERVVCAVFRSMLLAARQQP